MSNPQAQPAYVWLGDVQYLAQHRRAALIALLVEAADLVAFLDATPFGSVTFDFTPTKISTRMTQSRPDLKAEMGMPPTPER